MKNKEQTYELYFETSDEEIDAVNWIEDAIQEYVEKHKKTWVKRVGVTEMRNEWDDHRGED
jgi:hypothetical protein